jgi:hypothetical protein
VAEGVVDWEKDEFQGLETHLAIYWIVMAD